MLESLERTTVRVKRRGNRVLGESRRLASESPGASGAGIGAGGAWPIGIGTGDVTPLVTRSFLSSPRFLRDGHLNLGDILDRNVRAPLCGDVASARSDTLRPAPRRTSGLIGLIDETASGSVLGGGVVRPLSGGTLGAWPSPPPCASAAASVSYTHLTLPTNREV